MKSFRRNVRGQFVIIAALLISILTLSLVLSIHQINLNRQQLGYQPVQELVLGITSDLDRALTHALSVATKSYNDSGNEEYAIKNGTAFISKWVNSILASYSHLGLRMNINETGAGLTDVSWNIGWSREVGISQVYTQFDLDVDAYGFKGWVGHSGKFVTLQLFPSTIDITSDNQSTTLKFQVMQGKGEAVPIPNLTPDSLGIWAYVAKATRVPANITSLTYLGGGNYSVTFTPRIFEYMLGVDMTVITPGDNIFVSTYYGKDASFLLTLQSQEDNAATQNNGTIQFGPTTYSLPQTDLPTDPATYFLGYTPENASYAFVNWTTTGSVTVQNAFSRITSITIKGDGNATAFYRRIIPVLYNVTLNSRDWELPQRSNLGNTTLDNVTYTLPNNASLLTGDYSLSYTPANESYRFLWWETTGGIALWNPYSNSTTATITGNGAITAVYMARPPVQIPDPILLSQEDNNASRNKGQIRIGESVFNLNNSLLTNSGVYLLEYYPEAGYEFLNWTTSGLITVANASSNPTAANVTGDGVIIAFYRQVTTAIPQNFTLTLNSREWDSATTNLGSILLDLTGYTLNTPVSFSSGDHSLQYIPDSSHVFLRWETTSNIIVWNSTNNNTKIRILGDGTLTAVYSYKLPTITPRTITLQSQQDNATTPTNLGQIQFGTTLYGLDNSTSANDGTYLLEYTPASGYVFLNWTAIGGLTVGNASSSITNVTVNGAGTITVFYAAYTPPEPDPFQIDMNSTEIDGATSSLGNITLDSATFDVLPNNTSLATGNYILQYAPNDTYVFIRWEWTGDVIPWNSTAESTTLTVNGNGTITAIYGNVPPATTSVTLVLESMESLTLQNLGTIQLEGQVLPLPTVIPVVNGTYFLQYMSAQGYEFVNWMFSGDVTIADTSSPVTSAIVNGEGSGFITAVFRGCSLTLNSRHVEDLSSNEGSIMFNVTMYSLPTSLNGLAATDYLVQYSAPDSSYVFLQWEASANVIPMNSRSSSTTVRVLGDGTLTAVYYIKPAPTAQATVTLRSTEESSASTNLGQIRLGDTLFILQSNINTNVGTYLLEYVPAQGYTFISWTATGEITIENSTSAATNITVNGSGTIVAYYRGCDITLNSRHWENLSINVGKIGVGTTNYTLPTSVQGLASGNYTIQFVPTNSSNLFLWWEFSGNIIPYNSTRSVTTLRVLGDGTLTAVYILKPTPPVNASITLNSLEAFSTPPGNLGTIQLGQTNFMLPNSTTVLTGTYFLEYTPAAGYAFLNWTTTGGVTVQDPTSPTTSVNITGNAVITAFYRGCIVNLSSRHWQNSSYNLGTIAFGVVNYSLPGTLIGLPQTDYFLQYIPLNSSYVFQWWEQSGNVIPWNFTSNSTILTVYGDGNITAVYALITEPPPPFVGEWNTLYVDKGPILVPPFMWSLKSSHIPSWASTGADKQEVIVYSPPAPTIYLARYVNITAYVGIDPAWNAKSIDIEFGYNYSGQYYKLGNGTFPISSDGPYRMTIDSTLGQYPGQVGVIPEGSIFKLWVVVTFYKQPWGTFKLYYGPNQPSRIDLF